MQVVELLHRLQHIVALQGDAAAYTVGVFVSGRGQTECVSGVHVLLRPDAARDAAPAAVATAERAPATAERRVVFVGDTEAHCTAPTHLTVRALVDLLRDLSNRSHARVYIDSGRQPSLRDLEPVVRVINVSSAGMVVFSYDS